MTITEILSGAVPIRTEGVRWDLLDLNNNLLGQLMVNRDEAVSIGNDVTRSIRRTVDRIVVPPRPRYDVDTTRFYAEDINTLSQRVRPVWTYSTGDTFNLGKFVWGDDSTVKWSWGSPRYGSLTDLCTTLDQPLDASIGYDIGASVYQALLDQADAEGFGTDQRSIQPTSVVLLQPIGWVAGRDTRLTVMESLCSLAGFLPPYFDNNGILTCRPAPDLASAEPTYEYGAGTVVLPGSALFSSDILTAPNRYVVIGGDSKLEIVGIFDIPDAAPNSFANIGRRRRKTIDMQGLASQADANYAAAAAYASDSSTYSWLTFDTPVDPRHDTWDIVSFDGVNYRQLGWTIACKAGGTMRHDCRGTYA